MLRRVACVVAVVTALVGPMSTAEAGAAPRERITVTPTSPKVEKGGAALLRYVLAEDITGIDLTITGKGLTLATPSDEGGCDPDAVGSTSLQVEVTDTDRPAVRRACVIAADEAVAGSITAVGSEGTVLTTPIAVTPASELPPPSACETAKDLKDAGAEAEAEALIVEDAKENGLIGCKHTLTELNAEPLHERLGTWFEDHISLLLKVLAGVAALVLLGLAVHRTRAPSLRFGAFGEPEGDAKPGAAFGSTVRSLFSSDDVGVEDLPVASISHVDQHLDLAGLTKNLKDLAPELDRVGALLGFFDAVVPSKRNYLISGQLLPSKERGAGVTLVATRSGELFASDTLWLGTPASEVEDHDAYGVLALAAAAWSRHAVAAAASGQQMMTTPKSYAWLCAGLVAQREWHAEEAKRLFDLALEADPQNYRAVTARALIVAKQVGTGPPPDHRTAQHVLRDARDQVQAAILGAHALEAAR